MKKLIALLLALVMVFGLVACGKKAPAADAPADAPAADAPAADAPVEYVYPYADIEDYDELSWAIYEDVLGEFYGIYQTAKEAENISERHALMAIAEAKLLGSGVMLPLGSNGGNYAISRVAPYTATSTLWGNDSYRYHNMLVVAGDPIKPADRDALKALWNEKKGSGTWEASANA